MRNFLLLVAAAITPFSAYAGPCSRMPTKWHCDSSLQQSFVCEKALPPDSSFFSLYKILRTKVIEAKNKFSADSFKLAASPKAPGKSSAAKGDRALSASNEKPNSESAICTLNLEELELTLTINNYWEGSPSARKDMNRLCFQHSLCAQRFNCYEEPGYCDRE